MRLFLALWLATHLTVWAQTNATFEAPTQPKQNTQVDSAGSLGPTAARPASLTFTAATDQRFFFFGDTRNEANRRMPTAVYGARVGFLFPTRYPRDSWRFRGGRSVAFKAGVGFYFKNQHINRPGLLPHTSASVTRRLRYAMMFYEPYLLRRGALEVSLPLELGYGRSRYERNDYQAWRPEVARGVFVPVGLGLLTAYQFPYVRWLRPLRWFGLNVLTGYRFVLKRDVPGSRVNYNGCYLSIGPSFFLENLTADVKHWRQQRKKRK